MMISAVADRALSVYLAYGKLHLDACQLKDDLCTIQVSLGELLMRVLSYKI